MVHPKLILACRWIARILGICILGIFVVFFIGEGGMNPFNLSITELLMTFCILIVLVGIPFAWKKEGLGGAMIVGGMILFYLINLISSGKFPGGWVFPIVFVPGILFLICWFDEKKKTVVE